MNNLLEAELEGKLPEVEYYEDVLTSNVFGTIKYLPFEEGLLQILSEAVNYETDDNFLNYFRSKYNLDISEYKIGEILFWPSIEDYGEPDLVIILESKGSENSNFILGIEVKYQSHKSESGEERDQLKRYFESLQTKRSSFNEISDKIFEGKFLGIIYLTSYNAKDEIEESISHIENSYPDLKVQEKFFKMRWKDLTKLFDQLKNEESEYNQIYSDLYQLLSKKNLKEFEGITYPENINIELDTEANFYGEDNMDKKEAENITNMFEYTIDFYNQISKFYKDLYDLMKNRGWEKTESGSVVTKHLSTSINNPHKWLSKYAVNTYKNEERKGEIRGVLTYYKMKNYVEEPSIVLIKVHNFKAGFEDEFWANKFWQSQDEHTPGYSGWITGKYINNEDVGSHLDENFEYRYEYKTIPLRKIENKNDIEKKIVAELLD